ncbi:MAG: GIY-YIG nuclease family protein [Crocinitomicaceae bacterium]
MKTFHIYILKCADETYYTGVTSNLELRLKKHKSGFYKDSYTSKRLPVELVFYCDFQNANHAIEKEKQIKKWSRAKKEALINDDYEALPNLAKKKFD